MLTCTYCSTAEEVGGQGYEGQFQSNSRSAPVTSPSGVCLLSWLWRVRKHLFALLRSLVLAR